MSRRSRWASIVAHDDLSFFPLLYWPMDPREKDLSPAALSKIDDYMRNRRHHPVRHARSDAGRGARRRLAGRADLAPAHRRARPAAARAGARRSCADQGVLSAAGFSRPLGRRQSLGGGAAAAPIPDASRAPARGGDGVSPVIIGGNDWAAAWAVDANGQSARRAGAGRRDASAKWRSASASMW